MTDQLLVETVDLRRALRAVSAFVIKDADVDTAWSRIRLTAGPVVTYVQATNGSCAALAVVSTLTVGRDGEDSHGFAFDLTKADVSKILTCFPGRNGKDGEPGDELRVDVDDEHVTVTDASGLFEGQSLVLGRAPEIDHPAAVLRSVRRFVCAEPLPPSSGTINALGPNLALLIAASKVYDAVVVLEQHHDEVRSRTPILARIGEDFLALVTEAYVDEDAAAQYMAYRDSWASRLANEGLDDEEYTHAPGSASLADLTGVLTHRVLGLTDPEDGDEPEEGKNP